MVSYIHALMLIPWIRIWLDARKDLDWLDEGERKRMGYELLQLKSTYMHATVFVRLFMLCYVM